MSSPRGANGGSQDRPSGPGLSDAEVRARVGENRWFYLMLLWAGPDRGQDQAEAERIQLAHLRHLFELEAAGTVSLFGPIEDAGDLRGIGLLDVASLEEAEAIVARDPAVLAGRLRIEVKRWFTRPGGAVPAHAAEDRPGS
jgi:uncharacterized protein YciI